MESNESGANWKEKLLTVPMRPAITGHDPVLLAGGAPAQEAGKTMILDIASIMLDGTIRDTFRYTARR